MKLVKKILIVIVCIFFIIPSYADALSWQETIDGAKGFVSEGKGGFELFNKGEQEKGVSELYYFILGFGIVAAVVIGTIIAIQIITSGVEGKAKYKEKLIPFCLGCIVVFGGLGIWRIAVKLAQGIF